MQINQIPKLVELELTQACQLSCMHCLTQSHPGAGHGAMTLENWQDAIRQAAAAGTTTIQLIGGEPTVSPHWRALVDYILTRFPDLRIQVYSNLYSVNELHWSIFSNPRIALATSYYSDDADQHDRVTGKTGSHARTRANIVEALRRRIPLQIGIVEIFPGQRTKEAEAEMISLGVPPHLAKADRMRKVGRANPAPGTDAPVSELCGRCGDGKAAILPDGSVTPCVLGRGLRAGNILEGSTFAEILAGPAWAEHMLSIPRTGRACTPDDSSDCDPANTTACKPAYDDFVGSLQPIRLPGNEG